ncbi:MAG: L-Ala-D/L-Glu epimerase [Rhodospirillaceae bacterium]|nr:L-Ala-D/L-Glu epimerase [Rhodospirillaceae bacterium]
MRTVAVRAETWPLAKPFTISRGTKTEAQVLVVEISEGAHVGVGECVPYPRYGETLSDVQSNIRNITAAIESGMDRLGLWHLTVPGAARNAIDAALWDLQAKAEGGPVWQLAGVPEPMPALTAQTISLGSAEDMASAAGELASAPLIKVKLDGEDVVRRMQAVRDAAPQARLIADANEAWDFGLLQDVAPALAEMGIEMIEQPLPAGSDDGLAAYDPPVLLCADESCHTSDDLAVLKGKYGMVNIKLDKTGGLTEALNLARGAEAAGFKMMIGCMVGTSLAMAPAMMLASYAEYVDLDGPLLLKNDREPGLVFENGIVQPPRRELWG